MQLSWIRAMLIIFVSTSASAETSCSNRILSKDVASVFSDPSFPDCKSWSLSQQCAFCILQGEIWVARGASIAFLRQWSSTSSMFVFKLNGVKIASAPETPCRVTLTQVVDRFCEIRCSIWIFHQWWWEMRANSRWTRVKGRSGVHYADDFRQSTSLPFLIMIVMKWGSGGPWTWIIQNYV